MEQIKAGERELSRRVQSVKIIKSQSSPLMLRREALPTEQFKRLLCFLHTLCVFSQFERLLSGFLFIYNFFRKTS